jgi:hypothetical protein
VPERQVERGGSRARRSLGGRVDAGQRGGEGLGVTPITYVVDANGTIVHALRGQQSAASLRAALPPAPCG